MNHATRCTSERGISCEYTNQNYKLELYSHTQHKLDRTPLKHDSNYKDRKCGCYAKIANKILRELGKKQVYKTII